MRSLIVAGPLVQDVELIYPFYRLQEEGDVDVLSQTWPITGICGVDFSKIIDHQQVLLPGQPKARDYDLVVLSGGAKSLEKVRQEPFIIKLIAEAHERGIVIASICHGAQLMISAGLCKDRDILGYTSIKDDIVNAGGRWGGDNVAYVKDGIIISTDHYKNMASWLKCAIDTVNGKV